MILYKSKGGKPQSETEKQNTCQHKWGKDNYWVFAAGEEKEGTGYRQKRRRSRSKEKKREREKVFVLCSSCLVLVFYSILPISITLSVIVTENKQARKSKEEDSEKKENEEKKEQKVLSMSKKGGNQKRRELVVGVDGMNWMPSRLDILQLSNLDQRFWTI